LGAIDATVQTGLSARFDIKGFPQLKFLREGEARNYNGARTEEALVQYGKDMNAPAVLSVSSAAEFAALEEKHPVSAVFFGKLDGSSAAEKRMFDALAWRLQGTMTFVRVAASDPTAAEAIYAAAGVNPTEDAPVVLLVTAHSDVRDAANRFSGPWVERSLRDWLLARKLPLISALDANNFEDLTSDGRKIVLVVVDKTGSAASKQRGVEFVDSLYPLAKQARFRDEFVFAALDGVRYSRYVSQFGVPVTDGAAGSLPDVSSLPTVVVLQPDQDYYYSPPPQRAPTNKPHPIGDVQEVDAFLTSIVEGRASLSGTTPWYNPSRYLKLVEKSLSKLPGWQVGLLIGTLMLGLVAAMYYCCIHGLDSAMGLNMTELELRQFEQEKKRAAKLAAKKDAAAGGAASSAAGAEKDDPAAADADDSKQQGGVRARKNKAGQ
jgi:hypothetical protein